MDSEDRERLRVAESSAGGADVEAQAPGSNPGCASHCLGLLHVRDSGPRPCDGDDNSPSSWAALGIKPADSTHSTPHTEDVSSSLKHCAPGFMPLAGPERWLPREGASETRRSSWETEQHPAGSAGTAASASWPGPGDGGDRAQRTEGRCPEASLAEPTFLRWHQDCGTLCLPRGKKLLAGAAEKGQSRWEAQGKAARRWPGRGDAAGRRQGARLPMSKDLPTSCPLLLKLKAVFFLATKVTDTLFKIQNFFVAQSLHLSLRSQKGPVPPWTNHEALLGLGPRRPGASGVPQADGLDPQTGGPRQEGHVQGMETLRVRGWGGQSHQRPAGRQTGRACLLPSQSPSLEKFKIQTTTSLRCHLFHNKERDYLIVPFILPSILGAGRAQGCHNRPRSFFI